MKPIAVDVDDVMADLTKALHPALAKKFPNLGPISEWFEFPIKAIPVEVLLETIVQERMLEDLSVMPGAREAMIRLKMSGKEIVLVTARGYYPNSYKVTKEWFKKRDIPFDDLIVCETGQTKSEAVQELYPSGFSVMIDDVPKNLDDMKRSGLVDKPILITQPWNQFRTDFRAGINRFNSANSFVDDLQRQVIRQHKLNTEELVLR